MFASSATIRRGRSVAEQVATHADSFNIILIILYVVGVYAISLSHPTFNPEVGFFYTLNHGLTVAQVLSRYLDFSGVWYRPSTLYAYYQVVTSIFDWRNAYAYKVLSILLLAGFGVTIYLFARRTLRSSGLAAVTGTLLAVSHPVFFLIIYESVGFDLIYQIIVLLIFIHAALLRLAISSPSTCARFTVLAASYCVAITFKEQAIALPIALVVYIITAPDAADANKWTWRRCLKQNRRLVYLSIALVMTNCAFLWVHYKNMPIVTGTYRTNLSPAVILVNSSHFLSYVSRLFVFPTHTYLDLDGTVLNEVVSIAMLMLVVWYVARVLVRKATQELRFVAVVLALVIAFGGIPILFGGATWHYTLPAAGYCLLVGQAFADLVYSVNRRYAKLVAVIPVSGLVLLTVTTEQAFQVEAFSSAGRFPFLEMNLDAVTHPPVHPARVPKGAVVAYTYSPYPDAWAFGGGGSLFRLVYNDPSIKEIGAVTRDGFSYRDLQEWVHAPAAFFFKFDLGKSPMWSDDTEGFRSYVKRLELHQGNCESIPGALFFGQTGRTARGSRTASEGADANGYLTFGPYCELSAGEYEISIEYDAEAGSRRQQSSTWDIVAQQGALTFGHGAFPWSKGKQRIVAGVAFTQPVKGVEVRSMFSGFGTLAIHNVTIRRVRSTETNPAR